MNILEKIIDHKRKEVKEKKGLFPVKLLEQSIFFEAKPVSLRKYLLREDKSGIIAEIKRKSPSRGLINPNVSVERISIGYMQAGASALSILTDKTFFGGSNEDLMEARKYNYCPILRKDFIVDEYQILEAKSIGADAILLIASCLSTKRIEELSKFGRKLGLEVLVEVHHQKEISDEVLKSADIIGVNNRNLENFTVNIEHSLKMSEFIPNDIVKISESGIDEPSQIIVLKQYGFKGFLIGENFMRYHQPEKACRDFIARLRHMNDNIKVEVK
jgi:indole-3-glycerol phosphate synthase